MFKFPQNSWLPFFKLSSEMGLLDAVTTKWTEAEEAENVIYPANSNLFRAFELCDLDHLKVVLLGQDPYHGEGEANGLCFSVYDDVRQPPSLRNIFKELKQEYPQFNLSRSSDLSDWAEQGVLLINSVLTVEKDKPASHSGFGWQTFTDHLIADISKNKHGMVFILLGKFAQSKALLIDTKRHCIITAAHPSPFSAYRGFFGSDVFKKCNAYLAMNGEEIIW